MSKSIKYNPFKASSIVAAILLYISFAKNERKDVDMVIDTEDFVDNPLKIYQEKKEEAKRDRNFIKYEPRSMFRSSKENKIVWAADNDIAKNWKKEESCCVSTAIVGLYGNLRNSNILNGLTMRIEGPVNTEATFVNLVNKGRTLMDANMDAIQQSPVFQELVLDTWNQKVKPATAVGGPAPSEEITVEDVVMEVMLKDLKKSEICDKLDELGVEYNSKDKKAVLLDLLEKEMQK